jgi:hypothetical protein
MRRAPSHELVISARGGAALSRTTCGYYDALEPWTVALSQPAVVDASWHVFDDLRETSVWQRRPTTAPVGTTNGTTAVTGPSSLARRAARVLYSVRCRAACWQ